MKPRLFASLLFFLAVVPCLAGCGSRGMATAPVRGKITYQGKPVSSGNIVTMPEGDKPSATAEIRADGTFELTTYSAGDGAVLGKHAVMIIAVEDMSGRLPEERSPTPGLIIPEKYTSFATSGLTIDVKDGDNTADFELTK